MNLSEVEFEVRGIKLRDRSVPRRERYYLRVIYQLVIVHIVEIKQLINLTFWVVLVPNFEGAHIGHVEVGAVFALVVV